MHPVLENYLSSVDNLSRLEPKNLPFDVLEALGELNEVELFKACSQFFILLNNVPSEHNLINLSEEQIEKGAVKYAEQILERIKS